MTQLRRWALVVLCVYLALLAWALLSPTHTDQGSMVRWLGRELGRVGVPFQYRTFARLEVLTNVAIIAPATFLGAYVWRRWTWRDWTAVGFVGSSLVELVQGLLLPGRTAQLSDVVANTAGAFLGAAVAWVLTWRWRRGRSGSLDRSR